MSNQLTRIEREAKACADIAVVKGTMKEEAVKEAYKSGAYHQLNLAAPVVKALENRLAEWQIDYDRRRDAVDRHNNTAGVGIHFDYWSHPEIPAWVKEVKQILETYKNDNV